MKSNLSSIIKSNSMLFQSLLLPVRKMGFMALAKQLDSKREIAVSLTCLGSPFVYHLRLDPNEENKVAWDVIVDLLKRTVVF
ncbi:hypothetical protein JTE90_015771 [Oedothorax gibbosus]|uniref:Uncharacterized protein n=1 Tax=Oedothorax gibbosus TaxID=931172 RepID=A0AAV6VYR7_9ARAC|nr:hypothetical protein JTE90_015771 [Oedothorax gibbosus]